VIKSITIIPLLVLLLTSCVNTTQKAEIIVLNNTDSTIKVEIYNTWSGDSIDNWNLQKGINKFTLPLEQLKGIYANGFPEKTIYIHPNTTLTFEKDELILDEINKEVNAHFIWSQQIITGESESIFHWHISKNKFKCLRDWKKFDSLLFKLIKNPEFRIADGALKSTYLNAYPAAYMLLDKVCQNDIVSLNGKMTYINAQLENAGTNELAKNNFLLHYLTPQKYSLRNDSIIILTEKYFPHLSDRIKSKYEILKSNAKLKTGNKFPDFISEGSSIKTEDLTRNYKYTIIDFWATWCIPCIKQMPQMNDYALRFKNEIQFVSLSVDNKKDYNKYKEITAEFSSIKHYWLSDTTTIRENLGIKGLPRMILLDNNGKIIDPNFPHLYDTISHLWIKSLAKKERPMVSENL
jgi:thiol-disulfide isomerase/thioredoxin